MNDILAGFGVAILLEGLLWAVAPEFGRRMLRELANLPARQLAVFSWGMVGAGLFMVWLARG